MRCFIFVSFVFCRSLQTGCAFFTAMSKMHIYMSKFSLFTFDNGKEFFLIAVNFLCRGFTVLIVDVISLMAWFVSDCWESCWV